LQKLNKMEPSESDINHEYEIRRLTGLRQLAEEVNRKIQQGQQPPISRKGNPITNAYINNIYDKNSDYLYFSILARSEITNIGIPQELGYGYYYDKLFNLYAPGLIHLGNRTYGYNIDKNIVYSMLTHPNDLWFTYPIIYTRSTMDLIAALRNLKKGDKRDIKIESLIDDYNKSNNRNIIYREIINMMINDEFDVLDIIYILLYVDLSDKADAINTREIMVSFRYYIGNL
jgi:hypothetical protein